MTNNKKNLLLIKNFDYKKFLIDRNQNDWFIINLKEIRSKWNRISKRSFENLVFGCYDLNEKEISYLVKFLFILIRIPRYL